MKWKMERAEDRERVEEEEERDNTEEEEDRECSGRGGHRLQCKRKMNRERER